MAISFKGKTFKCGKEHSMVIEEPPKLAVANFHSWNIRGEIETYGGQGGRPLMIQCWIHDAGFTSMRLIAAYLKELDILAGEFGQLQYVQEYGTRGTINYKNCRFLGFRRVPFPGQEHPTPIEAVGPHGSGYGAYHVAGELWFYQLLIG